MAFKKFPLCTSKCSSFPKVEWPLLLNRVRWHSQTGSQQKQQNVPFPLSAPNSPLCLIWLRCFVPSQFGSRRSSCHYLPSSLILRSTTHSKQPVCVYKQNRNSSEHVRKKYGSSGMGLKRGRQQDVRVGELGTAGQSGSLDPALYGYLAWGRHKSPELLVVLFPMCLQGSIQDLLVQVVLPSGKSSQPAFILVNPFFLGDPFKITSN